MGTLDIVNCDIGSVGLHNEVCRDEVLAASGAHTYLKGTILAKRADAVAVTVAAGSNTGNGTCTAASVISGPTVPQIGAYSLKCVGTAANGGVFSLSNPAGQLLHASLTMTPGSGTATQFKVSGLQFTLTDGSADFAAGDSFTLTVTADGKVVPYDPTSGAGGVQTPYAVLAYQIVAAGAGNIPCRPIVAGEIDRSKLIIDADGTGVNVTDSVVAALRAMGIIATDVAQLARLDNQ